MTVTSDGDVDFGDAIKIYVAGVAVNRMFGEKERKAGGYGVYCPEKTEIEDRGRFNRFPTEFRAQMFSVKRALELVCVL